MKTAFAFAGQGCHYPGMAAAALDDASAFRASMQELDRTVRDACGVALLDIIYDAQRPKGGSNWRLIHSHLAIFCVQYALARAARERGWVPDLVLGYSLGEIVALSVAGVLSLSDALSLVIRQASIVEQSVEPGHLLVLLAPAREIEGLWQRFPDISLAAVNWPNQIVLAVSAADVCAIEAELDARGLVHVRLPVDYAFHSKLLDPARQALLDSMLELRFESAQIRFFSVRSAALRDIVDREHVWGVLRDAVNFPRAVRALKGEAPLHIIDLSPNASLKPMIAKNLDAAPDISISAAVDPFQRGRFVL